MGIDMMFMSFYSESSYDIANLLYSMLYYYDIYQNNRPTQAQGLLLTTFPYFFFKLLLPSPTARPTIVNQ